MTTPVFDPADENDPSEGYDRTLEDDASATVFTGEPEEKDRDEVSARPDRHWYPSDSDEAGVDDAASDADSSDEPGDEGSVASAHDGHSSDEDQGSEDEGSDYESSDYEKYVAASSEVSGLEFAEAADSDAEGVPDNNEGGRPANRDERSTSSFDDVESTSSFDEFGSSSESDGMVEIGRLTHGLEGPRGGVQEPIGFRAEMAFREQVYDREQRERADQFRAEFLTFARQAQHAYPELAQAEQWTAEEVGRWWREYRTRQSGQWLSALERTDDPDGPLDE